MEDQFIKYKVLEIIIKCEVHSFPVSCEDILDKLGINLFKYSELSNKKRMSCLLVSEESLKIHNSIYYNDGKLLGRARFSIMHELGHIVLGHGDYRNQEKEDEADYFASHILVPRMALHYANCKSINEITRTFGISRKAAYVVYEDYCKWIKLVKKYKMNTYDNKMYKHFYNEFHQGFVYSINKCRCGKLIYNSNDEHCPSCSKWKAITTYNQSDYLYGGF